MLTVSTQGAGPSPERPWQATAFIHHGHESEPVESVPTQAWFATPQEAEEAALEAGVREARRLPPEYSHAYMSRHHRR